MAATKSYFFRRSPVWLAVSNPLDNRSRSTESGRSNEFQRQSQRFRFGRHLAATDLDAQTLKSQSNEWFNWIKNAILNFPNFSEFIGTFIRFAAAESGQIAAFFSAVPYFGRLLNFVCQIRRRADFFCCHSNQIRSESEENQKWKKFASKEILG